MTIKIGNKKVNLNFDWQEGSKGEKFRLSSIVKGKKSVWISKVLKSDWFYIFKYESGDFFAFHFDETDNFKRKLTHNELMEELFSDNEQS